MKKLLLGVIILVLIYFGLWGYGYFKAQTATNNGIALLQVSFIGNSMNPISAKGYFYYFENNTDMRERINSIDEAISK